MFEDEYESLLIDYSGFTFNKLLSRIYKSMECFPDVNIPEMANYSATAMLPSPPIRRLRRPSGSRARPAICASTFLASWALSAKK